ncbi:hypothetical protein PZA11_002255 [Diplocarpon coronariae]
MIFEILLCKSRCYAEKHEYKLSLAQTSITDPGFGTRRRNILGRPTTPRNTAGTQEAPFMAPPAAKELPPASALGKILTASKSSLDSSPHPAHLHHLSSIVVHNLQYEHKWTCITVHTHSPVTQQLLLRPVVSGLPPQKAYVHPDEQVDILKAQHTTGEKIELLSEREWVLPTHLQEKMSLAKFAAMFDALDTVPPGDEETEIPEENAVGAQWQGKNRQKRMLLATVHDDSTVVYYIMHEGIVKPRQN